MLQYLLSTKLFCQKQQLCRNCVSQMNRVQKKERLYIPFKGRSNIRTSIENIRRNKQEFRLISRVPGQMEIKFHANRTQRPRKCERISFSPVSLSLFLLLLLLFFFFLFLFHDLASSFITSSPIAKKRSHRQHSQKSTLSQLSFQRFCGRFRSKKIKMETEILIRYTERTSLSLEFFFVQKRKKEKKESIPILRSESVWI